jgi:hypothetical protein
LTPIQSIQKDRIQIQFNQFRFELIESRFKIQTLCVLLIDLKNGKFPVLISFNFTEWLDLAQRVLILEYAIGKMTKGSELEDKRSCCLCKRSSRQTTLVCINAPRRNKRLTLPLHLAAEITDTCSPSLYISLLLAQIDNIIHSFLCALWLRSPHEQQVV